MLASLKLSLQTVTALAIFYLMLLLPSSFSMNVFSNLRTYDQMNGNPFHARMQLEKKEYVELVPVLFCAYLWVESSLNLPSTLENMLNPQLEKRERGSDPWNICPYGMSQVACFDKYLEVYSRMRKMADSNNIRQLIGKRSPDSPGPCRENELCIEI